MKLWRISQSANPGYDTYDSAVVAAETEQQARETEPSRWDEEEVYPTCTTSWCAPEYVTAEYIGEAKPDTRPGVILASFNAG